MGVAPDDNGYAVLERDSDGSGMKGCPGTVGYSQSAVLTHISPIPSDGVFADNSA